MTDLERLRAYDEQLSAEMPPDFKDWWENSPDEWPQVARLVLEGRRKEIEWQAERIKELEEKVKEYREEIDRLEGLAWELDALRDS